MPNTSIWGTLDPFFEGGGILGRNVANAGFLDAFLRADPFDAYHFYLGDQGQADVLGRRLEKDYQDLWSRGAFVLGTRLDLPRALAENRYHCFHLSDFINHPARLAGLRNAVSRDIFPITGVTHSLSYVRYASDFLAHIWPGCTERDCIMTTSATASQVVRRQFAALREAYGLDPAVWREPVLRTVPLGVDTSRLRPPTPGERAEARALLGLGEGTAMLLVFGRMCHSSKMDILPLLRAMQRLLHQGRDPKSFQLRLAGRMEEESGFTDSLMELSANIGLDCRITPDPDEDRKLALFQAADVFLSPVDNVQETFGLSVLEAGACGLPCVVSDYDGYRDLVAHGETGFLVPTVGPAETRELDLAAPLTFDSHTHLLLAQQTAVDMAALAGFVGRLLDDEGLRRDMGLAARVRVEGMYSWENTVRGCLEVWDELRSRPVNPPGGAPHPLQVSYGRVFRDYPSRVDGPGLVVRWTEAGRSVQRGLDFISLYVPLEGRIEIEPLKRLLFLARKPVDAVRVMERFARDEGLESSRARLYLLWALKHDLLERVEEVG